MENKFFQEVNHAVGKINKDEITFLEEKLKSCVKNKSDVYIFGNGGSSSIAAHIATDFSKNTPIRMRTLNDVNLITCFGNDFGYENWIIEGLKRFGRTDSFCIAISSSGNSENIVRAAEYARDNLGGVYCLTGFSDDNRLRSISDGIWVDSKNYNIVEGTHLLFLMAVVEEFMNQ